MGALSLYIHFPYCLYKCHYCDFNSYAVKDVSALQKPYVRSLVEELQLAKGLFRLEKFETIFLGGGTPSLFEAGALETLLYEIDREVGIDAGAEITLEANPKTLQGSRIEDYRSIGIKRFSVGIQSFQDRFLAPLGRLHDAEEAIQTLELLDARAPNYNFDLMFGFPQQSLEDLRRDLSIAARFQPKHLSYYGLTLEPGTILAEHQRQGKIHLPEEDLQAAMYEEGIAHFEKAGYALYEISNLSKPGYESRHNLAYWRYRSYLGLGAGAVSFLSADRLQVEACQAPSEDLYGLRWTNLKSPEQYRSDPGHYYKSRDWERIDRPTAQREFWMMGLRLKRGVSLEGFDRRFGIGAAQAYRAAIEDGIARGRLICEDGLVSLTEKGRLLANEVVSSFFI